MAGAGGRRGGAATACPRQGGAACRRARPSRPRRAPAAEQVLRGWRLARRRGAVQRRAAVGGARAHQRRIGAKEDAERVWAAVRRGEANRVHAVVAPHERRAGASVEQDLSTRAWPCIAACISGVVPSSSGALSSAPSDIVATASACAAAAASGRRVPTSRTAAPRAEQPRMEICHRLEDGDVAAEGGAEEVVVRHECAARARRGGGADTTVQLDRVRESRSRSRARRGRRASQPCVAQRSTARIPPSLQLPDLASRPPLRDVQIQRHGRRARRAAAPSRSAIHRPIPLEHAAFEAVHDATTTAASSRAN